MKFVDTEVTFSEIPDEICLCINISGCTLKCKGCHSAYLQEDIGENLTIVKLKDLIERNKGITCVCLMGGLDISIIHSLAQYIKSFNLKCAWYTGLSFHPTIERPICTVLDYIKVGPYIEIYGGLKEKTTNQRLYKKENNRWIDITYKFWKD